jgi:hypothetical protein
MTPTALVEPVGVPNRLRVDCVAGEDGGWVSLYINDTPISNVPIPADVEGFDAVGFTGTADIEGTTYAIDDVLAVAERPPPPDQIADIGMVPEEDPRQTWFRRDDTGFAFPDNWRYTNSGEGFFTTPGAWSFTVTPTPVATGDFMVLAVAPGVVPKDLGVTPEEFAQSLAEFVTSGGGAVVDGPTATTIGGLPAFIVTLDEFQGDVTGQRLAGEMAIVFGDSTTYALLVQYSEDRKESMLTAWTKTLDSFQP